MKRAVLIDVDTGYDDALALLAAVGAPELTLLGVTCVAGNQDLPQVVDNTLRLLDYVGAAMPVAAGAAQGLVEARHAPLALHGRDGMAELNLPPPRRTVVPEHAVEFMRRTLTEADQPVSLIALGPLTNLALLLRIYPDLRNRIADVTIMGGTLAVHGNTSPLAEFNIRTDPEAAAIVFESGLPVRLYPLDVFRAVQFTRGEAERLAASDTPAARSRPHPALRL